MKNNATVSRAMRLIVERYLGQGDGEDSAQRATFVDRLKRFLLVR